MDLVFRSIEPTDQPAVDAFIAKCPTHQSDFSIATLLLWTEFTDIKICIDEHAVYICGYVDDQFTFLSPLCDIDYYPQAVQNMKDYSDTINELLKIICATRLQIEKLLSSQNLSSQEITSDYINYVTFKTSDYCFKNERSMSEYVYSPSSLVALAGQKLQNKKHRLALFHHTYDGRFLMREMTDDDIDGIIQMTVNWNKLKGYDYHEELKRLSLLIENRKILGIELHLLIIDNNIAGMTMFQRLVNGVGLVLFEKCDSAHLLGFAELNHYAAEQMSDCKVINRQEDLGLEGLRMSKMTYQPVEMVEKFTIAENLENQILPLYKKTFGDSDELMSLIFSTSDYISNTALDLDIDKVVSCGFIREKKMRAFSTVMPIPYLFGIATDEKYRKQGHAKRVINKLLYSLYNSHFPLAMLCPAEDWLYSFYKKLGFMRFNFTKKTPFYSIFKPNTVLTLSSVDDVEILTNLFNDINKRFTVAQFRNVDDTFKRINEVTLDGGKVVLLSCDHTYYGYFLLDEHNQVIETLAMPSERYVKNQSLIDSIDSQINALNIKVDKSALFMPIDTPLSKLDIDGKDTEPSTMIRIVHPQVLMEKLATQIKIEQDININFYIRDEMLHDSIFNLKTFQGLTKIGYELDPNAKNLTMDITQMAQWLLGKIEIDDIPNLLTDLSTVFYEEY